MGDTCGVFFFFTFTFFFFFSGDAFITGQSGSSCWAIQSALCAPGWRVSAVGDVESKSRAGQWRPSSGIRGEERDRVLCYLWRFAVVFLAACGGDVSIKHQTGV